MSRLKNRLAVSTPSLEQKQQQQQQPQIGA